MNAYRGVKFTTPAQIAGQIAGLVAMLAALLAITIICI